MNGLVCDICGDDKEVKCLPLYTKGSEGTNVCLRCQIAITDMLNHMRSVRSRTEKECRMKAFHKTSSLME